MKISLKSLIGSLALVMIASQTFAMENSNPISPISVICVNRTESGKTESVTLDVLSGSLTMPSTRQSNTLTFQGSTYQVIQVEGKAAGKRITFIANNEKGQVKATFIQTEDGWTESTGYTIVELPSGQTTTLQPCFEGGVR